MGNLVHDAENYFSDSSIVNKPPTIMHDQTGHEKRSMLAECVKSKLVAALKYLKSIFVIFDVGPPRV